MTINPKAIYSVEEFNRLSQGKKNVFLNASILKDMNCFRYYFRRAIRGLVRRSSGGNYKQAYGTAAHKFLQNFYSGQPFSVCIKSAVDYYDKYAEFIPIDNPREFRTMQHLQYMLKGYAGMHKRKENASILNVFDLQEEDFLPLIGAEGKPTLEFKFAIPVWSNAKYNLFLAGTIDMIAKYGGHDICLVDHKTTSANNKEEFIGAFELSIQTMLYSKVFKELNNLTSYPPVVINAFFLKKPTQKAEKEGRFDGCDYVTSPVMPFDEGRMVEFDKFLRSRIEWIVGHLDKDCAEAEADFNYAGCHRQFGDCEYFEVCKLPPEFRDATLDNNFTVEDYNPLMFQD